ncbi:poly(glycerol-phosphate) alpha-glucosyltransferase [Listeria newyorkensis]|uniref:Poly(Glycerol-phosphate) alpha-glucosyltransferase n=1 Tax=Listeria newyorkensis TaxID=1497681 RepID=A0A841YUA1_9LIST|nr:poly(glycerol-phosphate) alpha-glucosyltransferase [Listeria newyorkensis]MBC1456196.1 poly(glycerol-phosphate) alpha-glucosyltransferase [Listeria newyorkensis]
MQSIDAVLEIKKAIENEAKQVGNMSWLGNWKVFLSLEHSTKRATVINYSNASLDYIFKQIKKETEKHTANFKIDVAYQFEAMLFSEWNDMALHTKKNYCRLGVSFDKGFRTALLEQEVNGNAMIQPKDAGLALNVENLNRYLIQSHKEHGKLEIEANSAVIVFGTIGFYFDGDVVWPLYRGELNHGRRIISQLEPSEVEELIQQSGAYLADQVGADGEFIYGYFSCFDKKIKHYNSLRHASSTYSMLESYEVSGDLKILRAAEKALRFLSIDLIREQENRAYVIERDNNEIKLGANAAAILAFSKYMQVTKNNDYLALSQKLAHVICDQQQEDGRFIHVLEYPTLAVKDAFRIIYYDGEAVLGLLRLYELDRDSRWLDVATKAFDHFIKNEYWKNHDHWLSYCTNEITKYLPEDRYFEFGLKNAFGRLDFIYDRATTFPTFLELTVATHDMCERIEAENKAYLLEGFHREKLERTIEKRADYQLNGFFYPELAMYYKNPARIRHSFFIRHHSFRVRIDDVEHNISGYCRYLHRITADLPDKKKEKMKL